MSTEYQVCPQCKALIEKIGGCNHMECSKCKTQFCYLCGSRWEGHTENSEECKRIREEKKREAEKIEDKPKVVETSDYQVFIKDINNRNIEVSVSPNDSVEKLKEKIKGKIDDVNIESLRLIYGGKQLENGNLLSDYSIQRGSTIHSLLRVR